MDFLRYADASAHLVNSPLADAADLRELVTARERLRELCTDRDASIG